MHWFAVFLGVLVGFASVCRVSAEAFAVCWVSTEVAVVCWVSTRFAAMCWMFAGSPPLLLGLLLCINSRLSSFRSEGYRHTLWIVPVKCTGLGM